MTDDEVYEYLGQKFEWNRRKAFSTSFAMMSASPEAATVFFDPDAEFSSTKDILR